VLVYIVLDVDDSLRHAQVGTLLRMMTMTPWTFWSS